MTTSEAIDHQTVAAICREFGLGAADSWELLTGGSQPTYKLTTSQGEFFTKNELSVDELALYATVESRLNSQGVRQPRLIRTREAGFLSEQGYGLFEYLPGETAKVVTPARLDALADYFADYHRGLRDVAAPAWVSALRNPWDQADSLDYLLDVLPTRWGELSMRDEARQVGERLLDYLGVNRPVLTQLPKQLIHGDAGPGNILYDGDAIVAIIDFTPYVESRLYALCVSLYWHCLYFNKGKLNWSAISRFLQRYDAGDPLLEQEKAALHPLFIKAAARMLFVQIFFDAIEPGRISPQEHGYMIYLATLLLDSADDWSQPWGQASDHLPN